MMTGMGEDVYEAGATGGVAGLIDEAADAAKAGYRRKNGYVATGDHAFAMDAAVRAVLESLGIPLEVLAALKAGTWQVVPKEPTPEMTAAGEVAFSTTHRHPNGVFTDMLAAAPTTPTEES